MKNTRWLALLAAALLMACGGEDDTDTASSSGGGGDGGSTTMSSAGGGGSTAGGGGNMGDTCAGITPMRGVLTPEQLLAMLDNKDFALINVHVPNAGEITGTDTHIAYTDVEAIEAYVGFEKGAKIVLYCRTGPMSQIASDDLVGRGYCNVSDMSAGSYQWEQLGYPYDP